MIDAIEQDQTVKYDLREDAGGIIDSYENGTVNMSNLKLLDQESDIQTSAIAQFVTERHETENYEERKLGVSKRKGEFDPLHDAGQENREKVLSELNGGVDMSVTDVAAGGSGITFGNAILRVAIELTRSKSGRPRVKSISTYRNKRDPKIKTYEKR